MLVLAPTIENGWKVLVGRTRPEGLAFGFPSGHATAAAAYVVSALYLLGRAPLGRGGRVAVGAVVVVVLGVGVGAARLALDAHWVSDVIGGWALGAACAAGAAWWDASRAAAAPAPPRPPPSDSSAGRRTDMRPFVEIEKVSFRYGEVSVLEDIDLTVDPGDFLGIIGPNGSGKTTLLRIMLGLLAPTSGQVRLFGRPPASLKQWGRLGYVPQKATFDPALPVTVGEVVASGLVATLGLLGRVRAAERQRVADVLAQVGMTAYAAARVGRCPWASSSAVLIARALVSDPELLILDEPTGGVDPEAQTSFYALLHHLNREREVTLILVSHDIGVVAKEVTRLACLNRRLIFHGRPGDFLSDAALAALYGPAVRVISHEH